MRNFFGVGHLFSRGFVWPVTMETVSQHWSALSIPLLSTDFNLGELKLCCCIFNVCFGWHINISDHGATGTPVLDF